MNTAKIKAVTQPLVTGIETAEQFLAYAARVSNPANQMNSETSERLLKYCIRNKHWSVFEMVNVVMEVETTRDIARQILRHRSFSFQEFSQRYADPTQDLGFVTRETRLQDNKNRQNSIDCEDSELTETWERLQSSAKKHAKNAYDWAISHGIAKEQARSVLPEGLTVSRMYMNGSLRSWLHYCELRTSNGTQKEHRQVAESAWQELKERFKFLSEL